jgi:5-methylthioadenosine/S-adenosylhomocysteine deaminase
MTGDRLAVDNRRVLAVDLERLRDRVETVRERLAAANADNRRLYEALEPVVGSFCPVWRAAPITSTATALDLRGR